MLAEWFDASSAVLAFSKVSKADPALREAFEHRFVRLLSLLHAFAVSQLREMDGTTFELIDPDGLDKDSIEAVVHSEAPVALIFQWVMQLLVENIENKVLSVPPPIVSRAFQEFANGMVAYHDALKIQTTDFPFPYQQMTTLLLLLHFCITPPVMCMWTEWASWVFLFTFIQVFVFWALYFTALEIEFPFRDGHSNYEAKKMHREFNHQLLLLIDPQTRQTPQLTEHAITDVNKLMHNEEHGESPVIDEEIMKKIFSKRSSTQAAEGYVSEGEKSPAHSSAGPQPEGSSRTDPLPDTL